MKLLLLNASPRKVGNIDLMLQAIASEAEARGADVECIRVNELQVAPCRGCMACRSKKQCVLPEDDAQRVLQKIEGCHALVIGAPCYWGNLPGTLKVLLDRMVYGMMDENRWGVPIALHKGKRAAVVSTSTTRWPFNIWFHQTSGVVRALREVLKWSGFKLVGNLHKVGTNGNPPYLSAPEAKACRRLVISLLRQG